MAGRVKRGIRHFHELVHTDIVVARDQFGNLTAYIREEHPNGTHVYSVLVADQNITEDTVEFVKVVLAGHSIYRIVFVFDDGTVRIVQREDGVENEY